MAKMVQEKPTRNLTRKQPKTRHKLSVISKNFTTQNGLALKFGTLTLKMVNHSRKFYLTQNSAELLDKLPHNCL